MQKVLRHKLKKLREILHPEGNEMTSEQLTRAAKKWKEKKQAKLCTICRGMYAPQNWHTPIAPLLACFFPTALAIYAWNTFFHLPSHEPTVGITLISTFILSYFGILLEKRTREKDHSRIPLTHEQHREDEYGGHLPIPSEFQKTLDDIRAYQISLIDQEEQNLIGKESLLTKLEARVREVLSLVDSKIIEIEKYGTYLRSLGTQWERDGFLQANNELLERAQAKRAAFSQDGEKLETLIATIRALFSTLRNRVSGISVAMYQEKLAREVGALGVEIDDLSAQISDSFVRTRIEIRETVSRLDAAMEEAYQKAAVATAVAAASNPSKNESAIQLIEETLSTFVTTAQLPELPSI